MKQIKKISSLCLVLLLAACADKSKSESSVPGGAGKSIEGSYVSCVNNGDGSSMKIHLTFSAEGTHLDEDIYSHASSTDCSGTGTLAFNLSAAVVWGPLHQSAKLAGATDVQLTPSVDAFGCGDGNPGYVVMVMAPDFSHFAPSQGTPACDASAVSTTLSTDIFNRE